MILKIEANFSLVDVLSIIAVLLGLLYSFQIITLKHRTKAIVSLFYYLLNINFIILFFFLLRLGFDSFLIYLTPLLIFFTLTMPINLFLYIKKIIVQKENTKSLRHYLFPILLSLVVLFFLVMKMTAGNLEDKIFYTTYLVQTVLFIFTYIFLALNILYLIFIFILLNRHKKNVNNFYSYTQKVDLNWVKIIIYAYFFLLIGLIVSNTFLGDWSDIVFYGVLIGFIFYIGHNALRQKEISFSEKVNYTSKNIEDEPEVIETTDQFSEEQLELFKELKTKLKVLMETEKPYLDQDLNILKIAKTLNTNTKYISYVINNEFGQNFINFINEYRINDVKQLLRENNQVLTIEAMGQNVGFKSKSAFNAAFKKFTGTTPSIFLKE